MSENQKHPRILAIVPSPVGFGFAVLEGQEVLRNWGVKVVEGDKNRQSLLKVKELIAEYRPTVLVLEDIFTKESRRGSRTRALTKKILTLASNDKIQVKLFAKEQIRNAFFGEGKGTKHALAQIVSNRFPEELGHRMPPERRDWDSESSRMAIFVAVALALMVTKIKKKF